ncbi:XRE family transcriptional regulator [Clostridium botulinum]|nr:XRE family transcriptional regulator [Clostridium botulinum]NFD32722.1 XRE family transcriptional regulator [Clostridium botulinum]NFD58477.1 XRE family transcriptional regulator [Clostridium botulinum]NFE00267.1 XRE family transcriptional regulator [Clostridium botulinum]
MNNIKKIRKEKEISIYELAKKVNLTPGYISNLENGHKTNPTKEVMEKISIALGQTVLEIFFS